VNPGSEAEAAVRLAPFVGARLRGLLDGGMSSLESRPDLLECSGSTVLRPAPKGESPLKVDVGSTNATVRNGGRVRRLALEELLGRLNEVPPRDSDLTVLDVNPYRAHAAASLLRQRGWAGVRPMTTAPVRGR